MIGIYKITSPSGKVYSSIGRVCNKNKYRYTSGGYKWEFINN